MDKLLINGGKALHGEVVISGAKTLLFQSWLPVY